MITRYLITLLVILLIGSYVYDSIGSWVIESANQTAETIRLAPGGFKR